MTFIAVVVVCLVFFVLLCWTFEDKIRRLVVWQRQQHFWQKKAHERISELEYKDYQQDARLDRQQAQLFLVKKDVKELGKDIGWTDDTSKTQVALTHLAKPDKPPDDAA